MTIPKSISGNPDLLSTADIAKELGVHRSTVHGWIKNGMLASKLHGNFHAVRRKDLERFTSMYSIEPKKKRGRR